MTLIEAIQLLLLPIVSAWRRMLGLRYAPQERIMSSRCSYISDFQSLLCKHLLVLNYSANHIMPSLVLLEIFLWPPICGFYYFCQVQLMLFVLS